MYDFRIDELLLPVTPSKFKMKINSQNETMTLVSGSEINILKSPGLTELEFTALLPAVKYPFAQYEGGFQDPQIYLERLKELKKSKKPFRFSVTRVHPGGALLFDTKLDVSLEDYTIEEDAEQGFDISVSIKLKEYRYYETLTVAVTTSAEGKPTLQEEKVRPTDKEPPKTYQVKPGDSLWLIAKRELGDGSRYGELAKLNGIANPNKINAGQVIKFG